MIEIPTGETEINGIVARKLLLKRRKVLIGGGALASVLVYTAVDYHRANKTI